MPSLLLNCDVNLKKKCKMSDFGLVCVTPLCQTMPMRKHKAGEKMENLFEVGSYVTTKNSRFSGWVVEKVQKSENLIALRLRNNAGVEKWTSVKIG